MCTSHLIRCFRITKSKNMKFEVLTKKNKKLIKILSWLISCQWALRVTTCWLSSYPLRDELSVIKVVSFILERQKYDISLFALICLLVAECWLLSWVKWPVVVFPGDSPLLSLCSEFSLQDFQLPSPAFLSAFLSTGRPYVGGPPCYMSSNRKFINSWWESSPGSHLFPPLLLPP